MPLLPPEPFMCPSDLFDVEDNESAFCAPPLLIWWVLHTRPRTEKALARRLLARSVGFFLPQYHKQWLSRGRMFSSHLPLFPGYIFLYGDDAGRETALETNLIVNCLPVRDQLRLRTDLINVHRLMTSEAPLTPEENLGVGDLVEITQGALTGLQGRILRRGKNLKFTVNVCFLQQGVSIEVERWMIQPVHAEAVHAVR